jgi:hypothetical protein
VTLVQLDDLNAESLKPLKDVAFLMLQTSPGNYQAWVAVASRNAGAEREGRRICWTYSGGRA